MDLLQQVYVLHILGLPGLDAVLQLASHQSGVEGQNPLPGPAVHAAFDSAQDMLGFLGCKCTLLGYVELLIHQQTQDLLLNITLITFSALAVLVLGFVPRQVQDFALGLVDLHELVAGPPLKPVKAPPFLQHVDHTTQLVLIVKLAECALDPFVYGTNKDVKQ
ncbi:hypothetical protein BTVI_45504 [Pitangus sulphuratus]|nr:hypothetical protein BTVI_45504 [Pitangus sulphuratus]